MITPKDTDAIEGLEATSEIEVCEAIQRAINAGSTWSFQGHYGRTMMAALEAGNCMLGPTRAHDFYGNLIPSRTDVKPGTKGSFEYVERTRGAEWARHMADLD